MRLIPILAVLVILVAPQPLGAEPDALARDLASDDPATLAWAAWNAAEAGRRDLRSTVVRRLRDALAAKELRAARGNLIDAVIRLRTVPDAETMRALVRYDADAAAVHVCRNGLNTPAIGLETFNALKPAREPWVAIGNALAVRRTPGFAARMLTDVEVDRLLVVLDRPEAPRPPPAGSVPYSAVARRPEGFPPVVHYTLNMTESGDLLSEGSTSVYVVRTVHTEPRSLFGGIGVSGPDPDACRIGWIHRMADPDVEPLFARLEIGHRFTGNQPFQREVARIANEVYERYWAIARDLIDDGRLTETEARSLQPKLSLRVRDIRGDKRPALPEPEIPEPRNPWTSTRRAPRTAY